MKPQDFRLNSRNICVAFLNSFAAHGFQDIGPQSILPQGDPSVYFTGASISTFKPLLTRWIADGKPFQGQMVVQPCLRLHTLGSLLSTPHLQFYSAFTMLGAVCTPQDEPAAIHAMADFAHSFGQRGLIRASRKDTPFYPAIDGFFPVELDSRPSEYYCWGYGTPEYTGAGFTLALRNTNRNFWQFSVKDIGARGAADRAENFGTGHQDVGNLIRLFDPQGRHIASEIGIGVETMAQAICNLGTLPEAYPYRSALWPVVGKVSDHFIDSLASTLVMIHAGVRDDNSKRGQLLNKAARNAVYTGLIDGLTLGRIEAATETLGEILADPRASERAARLIAKQHKAALKNMCRLDTLCADAREDIGVLGKAMNLAEGPCYIPHVVKDAILKRNGFPAAAPEAAPYRPLDALARHIRPRSDVPVPAGR